MRVAVIGGRLALVVLAAGCARFPAVSAATDPAAMAAPYPALLPTADLPATAPIPEDSPAGAALAARAAQLRASVGQAAP